MGAMVDRDGAGRTLESDRAGHGVGGGVDDGDGIADERSDDALGSLVGDVDAMVDLIDGHPGRKRTDLDGVSDVVGRQVDH